MVRQINLFLDDEEHEEIKRVKGDLTWLQFLKLACEEIKIKQSKKK